MSHARAYSVGMEDRFTRRGFVGVLAMGTASALWLPRARAVDRVALRSRWDARAGDELVVSLHVAVQGTRHEVIDGAIELRASLRLPDREALVMNLESIHERRAMRTRSGRRLPRIVRLGPDEILYDTFSAPLPGRVPRGTRLELRTALRGGLDEYPEAQRGVIAALADLRATVPVRVA